MVLNGINQGQEWDPSDMNVLKLFANEFEFEEFLKFASRRDPSKVAIYSNDVLMDVSATDGDESLYRRHRVV